MRGKPPALSCVASAAACELEEGSQPVVLMVSGGSDSTAMLLAAHELCEAGQADRGRFAVLHVDHGLRGEDSAEDAVFVEHLAAEAGFRFEIRRIDVQTRLAEFDGNMENAARHMRYELARELLDKLEASEYGAAIGQARSDGPGAREPGGSASSPGDLTNQPGDKRGSIWTAHTLDDRAETFFMRAIVGTGPGGLASIRRRRGEIARPLLSLTREQLRDYIAGDPGRRAMAAKAGKGLSRQGGEGLWREDATNYDSRGFRSFVRCEVVPLAASRNPNLLRTLGRTMDLMADEDDMLDAMAQGALSRPDAPMPLRRRAAYEACKQAIGEPHRITAAHVESVAKHAGEPGFAIDLPGGVRARNDGGKLVFEPIQASREATAPPALPHLAVSEVSLPQGVEAPDFAKAQCEAQPQAAYISAEALNGKDLEVGRPRTGERICPLGMESKSKLISDLLADRKIAREARERAIVIRAGIRGEAVLVAVPAGEGSRTPAEGAAHAHAHAPEPAPAPTPCAYAIVAVSESFKARPEHASLLRLELS